MNIEVRVAFEPEYGFFFLQMAKRRRWLGLKWTAWIDIENDGNWSSRKYRLESFKTAQEAVAFSNRKGFTVVEK